MQTLADTITAVVHRRPGITTADLAYAIYGRRQQPLINGECLYMAATGRLIRLPGVDGILRNFLSSEDSKRGPLIRKCGPEAD